MWTAGSFVALLTAATFFIGNSINDLVNLSVGGASAGALSSLTISLLGLSLTVVGSMFLLSTGWTSEAVSSRKGYGLSRWGGRDEERTVRFQLRRGRHERMGIRIVALLLVIASISVFVLWTVNPVGSGSETTFALYLAIDLISVALISYVHRSVTGGDRISRVPLIAGCCFILLLALASFFLLT